MSSTNAKLTVVPKFNERLLKPLISDPDRTTESIEARKLENKLLVEFNNILIEIQQTIKFDISNYRLQFEKAKDSLRFTVYDLIRSYYQKAYQLGTDYVNEALGTPAYLTDSDIEHIKAQTDSFVNRFWGRLEKMLDKYSTEAIIAIFDTSSFPKMSMQDEQIDFFARRIAETKSYLYSSLAILIITDGLNSATINKAKAIHETLYKQLPPQLQRIPQEDILQGAVTLAENDFQLMDTELVRLMMILNTLKYKWYTSADDRVCNKCRKLEGKTWTISLNLNIFEKIPTIPDDTHFNCRCRLFLESDFTR